MCERESERESCFIKTAQMSGATKDPKPAARTPFVVFDCGVGWYTVMSAVGPRANNEPPFCCVRLWGWLVHGDDCSRLQSGRVARLATRQGLLHLSTQTLPPHHPLALNQRAPVLSLAKGVPIRPLREARERVCVCERERESVCVRERESVYVCVCERESECVCVCVRERERERACVCERERD